MSSVRARCNVALPVPIVRAHFIWPWRSEILMGVSPRTMIEKMMRTWWFQNDGTMMERCCLINKSGNYNQPRWLCTWGGTLVAWGGTMVGAHHKKRTPLRSSHWTQVVNQNDPPPIPGPGIGQVYYPNFNLDSGLQLSHFGSLSPDVCCVLNCFWHFDRFEGPASSTSCWRKISRPTRLQRTDIDGVAVPNGAIRHNTGNSIGLSALFVWWFEDCWIPPCFNFDIKKSSKLEVYSYAKVGRHTHTCVDIQYLEWIHWAFGRDSWSDSSQQGVD